MDFILSEIFGFIALVLVCVGYFFDNKKIFLISQILANIFYALSYIFVSALVAGINTFISTFRCVYLFLCEKYNFKY